MRRAVNSLFGLITIKSLTMRPAEGEEQGIDAAAWQMKGEPSGFLRQNAANPLIHRQRSRT